MGVFSNIHRALDVRLNSLPNKPQIAEPNIKFTPTINTPYIRPYLLPASSAMTTLADHYENPGIYQIDIFVPAEKGANQALTLADDIRTHFEAERRLTAGSDTVFIKAVSIGQMQRADAWFKVNIDINYSCFSSN